MLIKKRDNHDADIASLQHLLECKITSNQRFLIEREMKCIGSGARGEDSSAYYIDFRYKDSPNWAILHDLRLEYRGFVAQIDHLLINRFLDFYVLESKNYRSGVKITPEGEFLVWNGKTLVALESPIEQNKRHIDLLQRVIQQPGFLPTKLGISISPFLLSYVIVATNSRVDRPAKAEFDSSMVIKADALIAAIDKRFSSATPVGIISSIAKTVTEETLETFARRLVRLHRPSKIDYAGKFGVKLDDPPAPKEQKVIPVATASTSASNTKKESACEGCGASVDEKVVYYCRIKKEKFGGKILCRSCQQSTGINPIAQPKPIEPMTGANATSSDVEKKGTCEKCGAAVDAKVAYFCRMNKNKFDGKILCRSCQKAT